jgi:Fe-S-cluster containining protein
MLREELLALYAEADALLDGFSCDASTDCCRFARTGREPYPTAVELAEVQRAVRASGITLQTARRPTRGPQGGRALPMLDEDRTCPLLDAQGRCRIYASRPFGCRTFYCDRASGPGKVPRAELQAIGRRIADLSHRAFPRDPHPRPLTRALTSPGACRRS